MAHIVAEMIMLFKLPLIMRVVVCRRENEASAELEECRGHRLDCFFPGGRQHVLFLSTSYLQSTFTYVLPISRRCSFSTIPKCKETRRCQQLGSPNSPPGYWSSVGCICSV